MKYFVVLAILLFSNCSLASEAVDNASYYKDVIGIFFNFMLKLGQILSLVGLGLLSWGLIKQVCNPTLAQAEGLKPATFGRYIGGIAVVSVLYLPLQTMNVMNDLTGLVNTSKGMEMCLVVDVTITSYTWLGAADECVKKVEGQLSSVAEYTNEDHIKSANLALFFGAFQLLALIFFLASAWNLIKHSLGHRDLKTTVPKLIISMLFASIVMASPNITEYIKDIKSEENSIMK